MLIQDYLCLEANFLIFHYCASLSLVLVLMISLWESSLLPILSPVLLQYSSIYLLSSQKLAKFSNFLWSKTYHSSIPKIFWCGQKLLFQASITVLFLMYSISNYRRTLITTYIIPKNFLISDQLMSFWTKIPSLLSILHVQFSLFFQNQFIYYLLYKL